MKLGPKLISAFVVLSILSLAVGLIGYSQINSVNTELEKMTESKVPSLEYSKEMDVAIWGQRDAAVEYMIGEEEGKENFQAYKTDFETYERDLRNTYGDTEKIDKVTEQHDAFSDLVENPDTGIFAKVEEKNRAIADARDAMEDFDSAAVDMVSNLELLENMQLIRKQSAQGSHERAIEAADSAIAMNIALKQQQIAAKSYVLGEDTTSDFVMNNNLYDQKYSVLLNSLNTHEERGVCRSCHTETHLNGVEDYGTVMMAYDMHKNFITFFYGGTLPYNVTLTMDDGTIEIFTKGQPITGAKPAYDNMVTSELSVFKSMNKFDLAAVELQTGNQAGLKEDEIGGDDNRGLDGFEEYSKSLDRFGAVSMDAMVVLNKLCDYTTEYLLEYDSSNLTRIENNFISTAVEFDQLLQEMDSLAELIDGAGIIEGSQNILLQEVRNVRDNFARFLDWTTDDPISSIIYTPLPIQEHGMFKEHDAVLLYETQYKAKLDSIDTAGNLLFSKLDTNSTLTKNATLRDLIWEEITSVNNYVIQGNFSEKVAFYTFLNDIRGLPYYNIFQIEHEALVKEETACINAYDNYKNALINQTDAMNNLDRLVLKIEYGDTDYALIDTSYNGEGPSEQTGTIDPSAIGDNKGLDYLKWRGEIYGQIEVITQHLSYYLKEQQNLAREYLLQDNLTDLKYIETKFLRSAESYDSYINDLIVYSDWLSDDRELDTFTTDNFDNHKAFLDMVLDIDYYWTVQDETDSNQDGIFNAHYNHLVDDIQMLEQLEYFDAMAKEISATLDSLENSRSNSMTKAETELNLANSATDYSMKLKTLLIQQMDRAGDYLLEDNATKLASVETGFNAMVADFNRLTGELSDLIDDGEEGLNQEEILISGVSSAHNNFVDYATDNQTVDVNQLHNGIFEAHDNELAAIAVTEQAMEALEQQSVELENTLDEMETAVVKDMEGAKADAASAASSAVITIFSVAIVAVIIGIAFGIIISIGITKPVNQLVKRSKSLADGDFNVDLDIKSGKDEIGELVTSFKEMLANTAVPFAEMNTSAKAIASGDLSNDITIQAKGDVDELVQSFRIMQDNLRELVKEIQQTSSLVSTTSVELAGSAEMMNASTQQVSSAIQQISQGSQSQTGQVEDTARIMQEMALTVDDVTNRAQSAMESSSRTASSAENGRKSVQDMVTKMREIQNIVNASAETIEVLGKHSDEIGQIVGVITNITDQTNLLALNAAIEAARAGDQGRGFTVVAEEVKNLAEDSRAAAERISTMIKEIQTETGKAVETMQRGTKEVEEGMHLVDETDRTFSEITEMAQTSSEMVQGISATTLQQKSGTDQVTKSIEGIASIAEESASASEESASSTEELTASMEEMTARAQELSEMAISLQNSVRRFKLGDGRQFAKKKTKLNRQPGIRDIVEIESGRNPKTSTKLEIPKKVSESLKKRGLDIETKLGPDYAREPDTYDWH